MSNFKDQQIYRDTKSRFSNVSLTELGLRNDRESMDRGFPLLGESMLQIQNKQELKQTKVRDKQEWSVQKSQHLNLINDLSSTHLRYNNASQYWIDKLRRFETVNEVQVYVDPNEKMILKQENHYQYRKQLIWDYFPIIEPTSSMLILWDTIIVLLIVVVFLLTLFHFYFTVSEEEQKIYWHYFTETPVIYIHSIIILAFSIDLFVEFHIAYFHQGTYITTRYLVARNYLRNGFIFDFIPLMMLIFTSFIEQLNTSPYVHYLIVLKFQQALNIDNRIRERLQLHRRSKATYLLLRLIVEMYVMINVFAAIFFRAGIIATDYYSNNNYWQSWLNSSDGNFGDIIGLDKYDQYILSMYWSFATMTTVAYGDITPMNPIEIAVAQFAMIGAVFIFAFNIQIVFEIYDDYRETQKKFQKYLMIVNRFMRDKQISYQLQNKIRKYLDHIWQQQRAREESIEDQIINQLAPQLKEELMYESYGRFLISIPWFREIFSFEFVRELSQDVEEVHYTRGETIFLDRYVSQDDNALYFLNEGSVELFVNIDLNNRTDVILSKIRQGSCFGQNAFITGQERTCITQINLQVVQGQPLILRPIEQEGIFPADYEKFCYLRDQIQFNKRVDLLNVNCLTCQATDHVATECPLSHYVPVSLDHLTDQILKKIKQDNNINPIQLRAIFKRNSKKRRQIILISEEQIKQAEEMDEEEDNPEQIDLQIAKLIKLQKLIEHYDEQTKYVEYFYQQ